MSKKIIILALGLLLSLELFAQAERQAIENIGKGKWEKAFYQLDKVVNKDTLRAITAYAWALYFAAERNPDHSLDSASRYIRSSVVLFSQTTEKQRERLRRFPLDSAVLSGTRDHIDSAAFKIARAEGTAAAFQHFLNTYPGSILEKNAVAARDERAFQDAVGANTYNAFRDYLSTYPASSRYADALANYERLLYQAYTRGNDLAGYERFLREHPGTSFESKAARNVFEIRTADGSAASFIAYLNGNGALRKRAADILFYLANDRRAGVLPESALGDSIRHVMKPSSPYLAPVFNNGRFGLMDAEGNTILDRLWNELPEEYLCGNITDDFIRRDSAIIALNGAVIYAKPAAEVEDLGLGMLWVENDGCHRIVHKSGWLVTSGCADQAKLLAGRFIAVQRRGKWQILTLAGRQLLKREWDGITAVNQFITMESAGEKFVCPPAALAAFAAVPSGHEPYSRIESISKWPHNTTWLRTDKSELLIDFKGDTLVATEGSSLTAAQFGVVVHGDSSSHTVNWNGQSSPSFRTIWVSGTQAIVRGNDGWHILDPVRNVLQVTPFDSLWWTGVFAVGTRRDSTYIHFREGNKMRIKGEVTTTSLQGPDSSSFLFVDAGKTKVRRLYAQNGKLLFQGQYDKVHPMGMGYFRVTRGHAVGVVTSEGKLVVPLTMDAVNAISNNAISLLKDGRFGLFHCVTRKMMNPQFPANLVPYGKHFVMAKKNGLSGLLTWDGKPATGYEFEEITYWNDTAAFVRRDGKWALANLRNNTLIVDQIRNLRFIRRGNTDQMVIINSGDLFGVLHSRKGTVVPLSFTDIVNVGSAEQPLFFTEKHIAEASMYVVIYYDSNGKFLRKDTYSPEDYERIYCPNN